MKPKLDETMRKGLERGLGLARELRQGIEGLVRGFLATHSESEREDAKRRSFMLLDTLERAGARVNNKMTIDVAALGAAFSALLHMMIDRMEACLVEDEPGDDVYESNGREGHRGEQ